METNKECNKCKHKLPIGDFRKRNRKLKSGIIKEYYESTCKGCVGKNVAKWYMDQRKFNKKNNPLKYKELRTKQKKWYNKYRNNNIKKLGDAYVIQVLLDGCDVSQRNRLKKLFKENPVIIEAKRAQLRLYRKVNPNHKNKKL